MAIKDGAIVEPLCLFCRRTRGWFYGYCDAFPDGIPKEILECRFDHTKKHPKDGGKNFVPMKWMSVE